LLFRCRRFTICARQQEFPRGIYRIRFYRSSTFTCRILPANRAGSYAEGS
jgi:hypothetical protein